MGKVLAICISQERGYQKHPVDRAYLEADWGIRGDAHAGHWHRQVSLLGAESCYIRRVKRHRPDPLRWLRAVAASLILLLGSALGLSWFHSDVDMPAAQVMVFQLLTGQEPEDPRWITVPYCVGVALGVAVFYALPSARAITPMEVKLSAYRADMEKAEGREIHDGP